MKKHAFALATALVATAASAIAPSQPAPGSSPQVAPFVADIRVTEYLMDILPASAASGGRPTLVPGVVRHGRWVYPAAESGACEQLEIALHGFILIPTTDGGVIQQPNTTSQKQAVPCPANPAN